MVAQIGTKLVEDTQVKTPTLISEAITLGRKHHAYYKVLPRVGVIDEPVEMGNWRFVPRNQDTTYIPPEADRLGQPLKDAGFTILQEIIGHEQHEQNEKPRRDFSRLKEKALNINKIAGVLAGLVVTVGVAAVYMLALAIAYDPALIYVMEDGTWLVIAEWHE